MIDGPYLHCTANIHYYLIVPWLSWDRHGIMGKPMPNKFSYILMRPIGGELMTTIPPHSGRGSHFLYLSNPPSGNLPPIIPWPYLTIVSFFQKYQY